MPGLKLQRELVGITASLSAFAFSNGMVAVFVPLVLIDAGASLWQVAVFYLAYALTKLCINFPVARFIVQRRGVHVALGCAFVGAAAQLALLQSFVANGNKVALVGAAVALALVNSCLLTAQHLHISAVMQAETRSSSLATMHSIKHVLEVAAPFVGGLIGTTLGPSWLLAGSGAVLVLAFVPLPTVGRLQDRHANWGGTERLRYSVRGAPKRDFFANFCFNIEAVVGTMVWPIFLAVELQEFDTIGVVSGIAALVTVVVLWVAGHRGDKGLERRVLKEAAVFSSATHLARIFVQGPFAITAATAAYKASFAYGLTAWSASYYGHTKRRGASYVMAMEIACDLAHVALWSSMVALAASVGPTMMFTSIFGAASLAAWGCLAISKLPPRGQSEDVVEAYSPLPEVDRPW